MTDMLDPLDTDNSTVLTFAMTAYAVMESYKHGFFVLFLLLYVFTIMLNSLLIATIQQNRELHMPMNIFTCMLSINELYGTTALLPSTMSVLMSETHQVPVAWCVAQVYFLHTYASAEFCVLAVMGYDRYIAICYPLHYHKIMSGSKVNKLIAVAALWPLIVFGSYFSLTVQQRFCGKDIPKLYCVNMELVKNSCSNTSYISIVGLVLILFLILPQFLVIIISYAHISKVCLKLPRESKRNALRTCVPHILSLMNYTIGCIFEISQTRLNMTHVAVEVQIFLSFYFIIIPPIANPVLYGLGTQRIRIHLLKLAVRHKLLPEKLAKAVIAI